MAKKSKSTDELTDKVRFIYRPIYGLASRITHTYMYSSMLVHVPLYILSQVSDKMENMIQ